MNDAMNQAINGLAIYAAVLLVVGCALALFIGHRRRQLAPLGEGGEGRGGGGGAPRGAWEVVGRLGEGGQKSRRRQPPRPRPPLFQRLALVCVHGSQQCTAKLD